MSQYKVLFRTTYQGTSIATTVVDFESERLALDAIYQVNNEKTYTSIQTSCVKLWR
jgi:hypothetical protein